MNDLALAKERLATLEGLRFEWSLKINSKGCFPRKKPLFWAGYEGDPGNVATYAALANLIDALDGPEELRAIQHQLGETAKCQGIRLDLEAEKSPTYCLYSNHAETEGQPAVIKSFHWQNSALVKTASYYPVYFKGGPSIESLVQDIHPALRACFVECCKNERLLSRSAYLQQYSKGSLQETYLAYFWHPIVALVAHTLPEPLKQHLGNSNYLELPFRYMGFSTAEDSEPEITLYFSAPRRGGWPGNFAEWQQHVTNSSKILVDEIAMFLE